MTIDEITMLAKQIVDKGDFDAAGFALSWEAIYSKMCELEQEMIKEE